MAKMLIWFTCGSQSQLHELNIELAHDS